MKAIPSSTPTLTISPASKTTSIRFINVQSQSNLLIVRTKEELCSKLDCRQIMRSNFLFNNSLMRYWVNNFETLVSSESILEHRRSKWTENVFIVAVLV